MSDSPSRKGVLSEEVVRREGYREDAPDNPYWAAEEPDPHPDPSLGCVRRGLCCHRSPGRFSPGEAEAAAEAMDVSPDDFVRRFLIVDWLEDPDGERVHMFAPVKLGQDGQPMYETGRPVDRLYQLLRGTCIFFRDNGCGIYETRPTECARYICTNAPEDNMSNEELTALWQG